MTLRVHFTSEDLASTTVTTAPDMCWELTSSLHRLQTPRNARRYQPWLRHVRARTGKRDLRRVLGILTTMVPRKGNFPDFLTPYGAGDFAAALELVRATPVERLRRDLITAFANRPAPLWIRRLATGDRGCRKELVDALAVYHRELLRPCLSELGEAVLEERARCGWSVIDGGVERLLCTLAPTFQWDPPVLSTDYPTERELHLDGRGITLIPSTFCHRTPVTFIDPELPPVLVYPLVGRSRPAASRDGLAALLGSTRTSALGVLTRGACSTSELAVHIDVSAGTASRHAAALRAAGLISSARHGSVMLHTATQLGRNLVAAV